MISSHVNQMGSGATQNVSRKVLSVIHNSHKRLKHDANGRLQKVKETDHVLQSLSSCTWQSITFAKITSSRQKC